MAWRWYNALVNCSLLVLDARSEREYKEGHLKGSVCVCVRDGSLHLVTGPGPWSKDCWWDMDVLVVPAAQSKKRKHSRLVDPVAKFLENEGRIKSLRVMEDDEGTDVFSAFAKAYPFLVVKSLKPGKIPSYPAEVVPKLLYLGNLDHAMSTSILKDLGITHVLTIHTERLKEYAGFSHIFCELADEPKGDISSYFDQAFQFIEQARTERKRVLVHCGAGASRSATLCAYYLMRRNQWSADKAVKFLKEQRKQVDPNPGFLAALKKCESQIFPQRVSLLVYKDQELVEEIDLSEKTELLIGRLPECDVVMEHASISRKHARIVRRNLSWCLIDLGSVHGTFVNGERIVERELHTTEKFSFGASSRKCVLSFA